MEKNRLQFRMNSTPITRSVVPPQTYYQNYRDDLARDFNNRCGYCDSPDRLVRFEIDHFVPISVAPHLENDYSNLVYSCEKCNRAKSNKCSKIENGVYDNTLFYDPARVDFNTIFYRNYFGEIKSDDEKGVEMIISLKLFRPVYRYAWFADLIQKQINFFEIIKKKTDLEPENKILLLENINKLLKIQNEVRDILTKSINKLKS